MRAPLTNSNNKDSTGTHRDRSQPIQQTICTLQLELLPHSINCSIKIIKVLYRVLEPTYTNNNNRFQTCTEMSQWIGKTSCSRIRVIRELCPTVSYNRLQEVKTMGPSSKTKTDKLLERMDSKLLLIEFLMFQEWCHMQWEHNKTLTGAKIAAKTPKGTVPHYKTEATLRCIIITSINK
jgi:hypothetical protein